MTQKEQNTETGQANNHEFDSVEVVDETEDGIVVQVETGGDTYECPVPTGEYYGYGDVEVVYAHEYELNAKIVTDDGQIREAEISGDGVEEVRTPTDAKSPEALGAEVVYDARPEDVQRSRAETETELESYRTEWGHTLYVHPEDYIDSEWAGEDGIKDGARVAFVDIDGGHHTVCVGVYEGRGEYEVTDDVGGAFTLQGALEIAEEELER